MGLGPAPRPFAPVGGAFTEIGTGSQRARFNETPGASTTAVYPGNVVAGNLLIATGILGGVGVIGNSIGATDTVGTSYTVIEKTLADGLTRLFIAYGIANASGANTITLSQDQAGQYNGVIDEFSTPNATPLNVDGGLSEGTSTAPSDAITTTADNALIIGVYGDASATATGSITENDGTLMAEDENGITSYRFSAIFLNAPTQQSYTIDWTLADSLTWGAQTASFKP